MLFRSRHPPTFSPDSEDPLHANTWVAPRDRDRLEALCRYAARPAVSESRLAEQRDGQIGYALKRRYRDGTTAVVMTNAVLMERLCALVPPPRKHLVTYHGALAPAAGLRPKVVPRQTAAGAAAGCRHGASDGGDSEAAGADDAATTTASAIAAVCRQQAERRARVRLRASHRGGQSRSRRRRLPRADLLRRVFGIDVLVCPQCAGPRRVLAAIHDPAPTHPGWSPARARSCRSSALSPWRACGAPASLRLPVCVNSEIGRAHV